MAFVLGQRLARHASQQASSPGDLQQMPSREQRFACLDGFWTIGLGINQWPPCASGFLGAVAGIGILE